jgi:hypothetical protein
MAFSLATIGFALELHPYVYGTAEMTSSPV